MNNDSIIEFNKEQLATLTSLGNFMNNSFRGERYAITGKAGTGKTTVIKEFINRYSDYSIMVCAPTHKALRVIHKGMNDCDSVVFMTIHKALGIVPLSNEDKKELTQKGKSSVSDYDVLIIDEASMLPKDMLDNFLTKDKLKNTFTIFIGDDKQLPPVLELNPTAFNDIRFGELIQPMRSPSYPTYLADYVRLCVEANYFPSADDLKRYIGNDTNYGVWIYRDIDKFMKLAKHKLVDVNEFNLDKNRLISFTNKSVHSMIYDVRSSIYDDPSYQWYEGEYVVAYQPIYAFHTEEQYTLMSPMNEDMLYANGTEFQVLETKELETLLSIDIKCPESKDVVFPAFEIHQKLVRLRCLDDDNIVTIRVPVNIQQHVAMIDNVGKFIRNQKFANFKTRSTVWDRYNKRIKNSVAQLNSTHAITCHKSQGSTLDNVFVNARDIQIAWNMSRKKKPNETQEQYQYRCVEEKRNAVKLLYVAVSRARYRVIMLY